MIETTLPARKEIAKEYTWNAESVYPDKAAWETELKALVEALPGLKARQGRLIEGPGVLAQTLELRDNLLRRVFTALMYAQMSHEVDKGDPANASMPGQAQAVLGQALAVASFIEPELLAIGQAALEQWLEQEPRLNIYAHYLQDMFRKQAHVRSAEIEELLGMLAEPLSSAAVTAGMLTDADLQFRPVSDSQGNPMQINNTTYDLILAGADRPARRSAWESYCDGYLAFKNTLANNLLGSMKQFIFTSRARRFPSSIEASLFEFNIPLEVYHNLVDTFRKHLPTWQRYFALRRRALNQDDLHVYDIWTPLAAKKNKIPFQQAVDWISEGLAPLGDEYVAVLRKGCLEERWVDYLPNQNKTNGAFSSGVPGTHPFIVMSYTGEIFDLSTLAHELGHSMHSYQAWKHQPPIYGNYSLFVAEVASNFHQAMVRAYLFETQKEPHFQIALIEEAMANFYRYFFTMPTLARFELEVHQHLERGEGLSADDLNNLMADLFQESYGDQVQIDRARYGITWATFGHLYADYYVYQYATGISAANALSRRILSGAPGAAQDYLKFLQAGASLYPLDALKLAGVDLTTPQAVEESFAVLADLVDRLETLVG